MAVLIKDPEAILDYSIDWAAAYLVEGETVTASAWTVWPEGDIVVTGDSHASGAATAAISGGVAGNVYRLTNRISTSFGRTDDRSIIIRCEEQ